MAKLKPVSPPADADGMRAKDLKNLACLIQPVKKGNDPKGRDGEPWDYWSCDVHVLGPDGIKESGTNVRISWGRSMNQLEDAAGNWIAVRPVEDGRAVILEPLEGADLAVAERVLDELDG
jgi:hypothetical protein